MNDFFLVVALLVPCAMLLIGYLLMVYAAYFVLPEVEGRLKNCKLITDTQKYVGNIGHVGRMYRYAMAGMVFTSTRFLLKNGMIDIDEVSKISLRHRRWMCLPSWLAGTGFFSTMTFAALRGHLW
jgi:hypothetical protein